MFKLSNSSLSKLNGVNPLLVNLIKDSIKITQVDFGVTYGLRTKELQAELVKAGKSRTMNSRHLTGHAVDLAAYIYNVLSWDTKYYYEIARAIRLVAIQHNTPVVWGGVWDKLLNELSEDLESEVKAYHDRYKVTNPKKKPLFDGPHFELSREAFPA